ncbi:MAG: ATP-binding protein, partial [Candidatus Omnitrophica bacterium]|nr:ATP-binding protein [Candidatus Omnitrophota bacterium]
MSINTNWYIIIGAPSSGKTEVIRDLAFLGYTTLAEVSRDLIDAEISKGKTVKEVRVNEAEFQKRVLQIRIKAENKIPPKQTIFIDGGGIPSNIAYYQIVGLDPTIVIKEAKKRKYRGVFFLERLPFEKDYARVEDEKIVSDLDRLLYEAYVNLGYDVIR